MAANREDWSPLPPGVAVVATSGLAISLGAAVLIGWACNLETLKSVVPGLAPMEFDTALSFLLLGLSLALANTQPATRWQQQFAQSLSGAVLLLAAWSLGQGSFVGPGLNSWFFGPLAGAMPALTAVSLASLASASLLLRTSGRVMRWLVQCGVAMPLLIATRGLVEYVYHAHAWPVAGDAKPLAAHTMATLFVLCIGLLYSRSDLELMAVVRRRSAGATAARRLLPIVLCVPLLVGLICLRGELSGWYGRDTSLTLFTIAMCGLIMLLVWWAAHSIDDVDVQRQIALRAERQFRELSDFDPLTGLLNRRSFLIRCEQECLAAKSEGSPLACIMVDIDYFKKINDTYGHSTGDGVLRKLAELFCEECRANDVICRYGGEEFCILLPNTNEVSAVAAAQRIRSSMASLEILVGKERLQISGSLGAAEFCEDAMDAQSLINRADQALLVAKQTGRDRVVAVSSLADGQLADDGQLTRPLAGLLARDIMVPVSTSLNTGDTIRRAAHCLLQLRLESAPVIDDQGKLAGLVTDQDVMAAMITREQPERPVSQIMHRTVVCFEETTTADEIFLFLSRVSIPRVVVIRDGSPVGVLSRTIVLRWLYNAASAGKQDFLPIEHPAPAVQLPGVDGTIAALAQSAWRMAQVDEQSGEDLAACVIGEATRMQELIEQLLSLCQRPDSDRPTLSDTVAGAHSFA
jgi:diguanylate cyclase (GGDEF)-like protein